MSQRTTFVNDRAESPGSKGESAAGRNEKFAGLMAIILQFPPTFFCQLDWCFAFRY